MSLEKGAMPSASDHGLVTYADTERPKKQKLDEFLVKESFVPSGRKAKTRKLIVGRRRAREENGFAAVWSWVVDNQVGLSINLLALLGLVHACLPRARVHTRKFFKMSYYNSTEQSYTQGWDDLYFVFLWFVIFTGVRVAVMDHILTPFAKWGGIESPKGRTRFAEQGWSFSYYVVFWTLGMYIYYHSDYWLNLQSMWTNFPTHTMTGLMKWYYLVQFAFWLQQLFVVNIEERRKDHWQMFTHHIFTSALLVTSYGFYQTKVGNVILCIMDIVDIFLPFAKMLNYLGYRTLCDIAFGVFMAAWFLTRHVCYNLVCWSIHADVPKVMPYGCFDSTTGEMISENGGSSIWTNVMQPFNRPNGVVCFNNRIRVSFLSLLLALQVLTLIWFGMIIRVAYGVLSGNGAQEVRSDDEGDDETEEEEVEDELLSAYSCAEKQQSESVRQLSALGRDESEVQMLSSKSIRNGAPLAPIRKSSRMANGRTTAISLPELGDHKELLGRIGCDKPS